MFPMTVTINSLDQLNAVMALLAGTPAETVTKPARKAKTETAQATVANNGASSTPEPTASSPAEAVAQEPTPAAAATAPAVAGVSYDEVKGPFLALVAKNRQAALDILAKYSAAKLSEIKPENFSAVLADIKESS